MSPAEDNIAITEHRRIVVAGAHPDDAELGVGGTMALFCQMGYEVIYVCATKGERGGNPVARVQESRAACKILGVDARNVFFGDFPDTCLPYNHDTIEFLEGFISDGLYAAFVPSVHDFHQDHRNLALSCMTAFRSVPRLLAYESPSRTGAFTPNAYVDIGEHIRAKRAALRCHKTQIRQRKTYMEYRSMIRLAESRGQEATVAHAEGFETIRFLVEPSLVIAGRQARPANEEDCHKRRHRSRPARPRRRARVTRPRPSPNSK